jgi:hypothetical protein
MSQIAYEEFIQLEEICIQVQDTPVQQGPDSWSYIWGTTEFSTKKAYSVMMAHNEGIPTSHGYGNLLVSQDTNFSSGYCFMTG